MILLVNGAGGDCHVAVSSQNRVRPAGDKHRCLPDDRLMIGSVSAFVT